MPKVAFHTLGCKVNHYETEAISKLFLDVGYERVEFQEVADVYIINTCTVTNTGDKKSRQIIRRAIRKNPEAIICVTGCYAQTSPAEVLSIEGVDLVIGTQGREKLLDYIEQIQIDRLPINAVSNIMKTKQFESLDVENFSDRTRATLKIQEGCNNFCTYCIIPWARGLMRSRPPEDVIIQAQKLVDAGHKEIVLTGIHTGGYGEDLENYSLLNLLKDLDTKVEGLHRIRISSIEATQVTDEVIQLIKESKKFARHLHIPIQSGSNTVLSRMKRKYSKEEFGTRINRIVEEIPGVSITTDVIVGFPGETEEEFVETYEFIEQNPFSELHVFPYSKRTGTPAAVMTDQVPDDVKNIRVGQLISLSKNLALKYSKGFEGKVIEVIPEELQKGAKSNLLVGHGDNYLKIAFEGSIDQVGRTVSVKITHAGYPLNQGIQV